MIPLQDRFGHRTVGDPPDSSMMDWCRLKHGGLVQTRPQCFFGMTNMEGKEHCYRGSNISNVSRKFQEKKKNSVTPTEYILILRDSEFEFLQPTKFNYLSMRSQSRNMMLVN